MTEILPVFKGTGPQKADAIILDFPKIAADGSLEQVDLQKRVQMYQMSSVQQAVSKNRG